MPPIPQPANCADAPSARKSRRGHGRPTLHDVAERAGVTRITVSRFLREPALVAPETAQRVRSAIEAVGYVPNLQAGQLASGHSRIVATLIPNAGHSVFAETIQGLTEGLRDSGYELLLTATGYSPDREELQLRAVLGWSPAAIIVTGLHRTPGAQALLEQARAGGTPVVEIWDHSRRRADQQMVQVGFDHRATGRLMARHLLTQGHQRIAYVDSGVVADVRAHRRRDGFVDEVRGQGGRVEVITAAPGDALDAGRQAVQSLLALRPRTTAAAFANDHLAAGALLEAQAQGVSIPGRMAFLGFGDFPISRHLHPGLSTVHTPTSEIGRIAAQSILQWLALGEPPASSPLACTLIPRQSTAAPCPTDKEPH
jgi:LacI family gluconate utilization system Gnt-I transcriptional repressor